MLAERGCRAIKYRKKRKKSPCKTFLFVSTIFILLISIAFAKMQPVIMNYAESCAETIMLNCANEAILSVLQKENISYDDIARLSLNDEGYVTSLEIDTYSVNALKSKISNELSYLVDSKEHYKIGIPLGSFFDNNYTQGFGPKIQFNMHLTSTAFVTFSHEFKSAGINQVLHIINVEIEVKGSFVMIGYTKGINVKTSAIAAQTVIVGKTPEAFTNVIESEKDNTGGLINDYGAIAD